MSNLVIGILLIITGLLFPTWYLLACLGTVYLLGIILFKYVKRNYLQWLSCITAIVCGFYGFFFESSLKTRFLSSAYSTVRLFGFNTDEVFLKDATSVPIIPLSVEIARWAAIVSLVSTLLLLLFRKTVPKFRYFMWRLWGRHDIIIGRSEFALALARDLLQQHKRVLLVCQENEVVDELVEKGAVRLDLHDLERNPIKTLSLRRARNCLLLDDRDNINFDLLIRIKEAIDVQSRNGISDEKVIRIVLHLNDRMYMEIFEGLENEWKHARTCFDVRVINMASLMAKLLLEEHPIHEHPALQLDRPDERAPHFLIAGFNHVGQNILIQLLLRNHYPNGHNPTITLMDAGITTKYAEFHKRCPMIEEMCTVFLTEMIPSQRVPQPVVPNAEYPSVTHIYVCIEDDGEGLVESILLRGEHSMAPIYFRANESIALARWIKQNRDAFHRYYEFGDQRAIATERYMIDEELDQLAKRIHGIYSKNGDESQIDELWNNSSLSVFQKDSNRAQAEFIDTKLYLLGLKRVHKDEAEQLDVLSEFQFLELVENQKEELGRIEHERWNSFHFVNGWRVKTDHSDPTKHKQEDQKMHACLVSWEDLAEIEQIYGQPFKQYDIDTITELYGMLEQVGYAIVKE